MKKIQKNQIYTNNQDFLTKIKPFNFKRGLHNKYVCMGKARNKEGVEFYIYPAECGLHNNCFCWATALKNKRALKE